MLNRGFSSFKSVTFDLEGLTLSPAGQEQLTAAGFFCSALVGFGVGSGSGGGSVTRDCSHWARRESERRNGKRQNVLWKKERGREEEATSDVQYYEYYYILDSGQCIFPIFIKDSKQRYLSPLENLSCSKPYVFALHNGLYVSQMHLLHHREYRSTSLAQTVYHHSRSPSSGGQTTEKTQELVVLN